MKNRNIFIFVSLIFAFSSTVFANEDSEISEKARSRQYAGGADEEDLKVVQLPVKDQKAKTDENQESNEGY